MRAGSVYRRTVVEGATKGLFVVRIVFINKSTQGNYFLDQSPVELRSKSVLYARMSDDK